jgi:hypothetical protein
MAISDWCFIPYLHNHEQHRLGSFLLMRFSTFYAAHSLRFRRILVTDVQVGRGRLVCLER